MAVHFTTISITVPTDPSGEGLHIVNLSAPESQVLIGAYAIPSRFDFTRGQAQINVSHWPTDDGAGWYFEIAKPYDSDVHYDIVLISADI